MFCIMRTCVGLDVYFFLFLVFSLPIVEPTLHGLKPNSVNQMNVKGVKLWTRKLDRYEG